MIETTPEQDAWTILQNRAQVLARTPIEIDPGQMIELVIVEVGSERQGVEIQHVREIQPVRGLTPIPSLAPFWAGLVNLRGTLFPVLHLGRYLNLESDLRGEDLSRGQIVLVSDDRLTLALWVNEVVEVRQVPSADVVSPGGTREVVRGVTSDLIVVLDLPAILADPKLTVND